MTLSASVTLVQAFLLKQVIGAEVSFVLFPFVTNVVFIKIAYQKYICKTA